MGTKKKYWFWAWLIQSTVAKEDLPKKDAACEVWFNLIVINAVNEKEAFAKANKIGETYEGDSRGTLRLNGRPAISQFLGIEALGVIHEDLADCTEILTQSKICSQAEARTFVANKRTLLLNAKKELGYKKIKG